MVDDNGLKDLMGRMVNYRKKNKSKEKIDSENEINLNKIIHLEELIHSEDEDILNKRKKFILNFIGEKSLRKAEKHINGLISLLEKNKGLLNSMGYGSSSKEYKEAMEEIKGKVVKEIHKRNEIKHNEAIKRHLKIIAETAEDLKTFLETQKQVIDTAGAKVKNTKKTQELRYILRKLGNGIEIGLKILVPILTKGMFKKNDIEKLIDAVKLIAKATKKLITKVMKKVQGGKVTKRDTDALDKLNEEMKGQQLKTPDKAMDGIRNILAAIEKASKEIDNDKDTKTQSHVQKYHKNKEVDKIQSLSK